QTVYRVSRRMGLRDLVAGEALAPGVVVAVHAGEMELADALLVELAAFFPIRLDPRVVRRRNRLTARLQLDIGGQGQQIVAFVGERRGPWEPPAGHVDVRPARYK